MLQVLGQSIKNVRYPSPIQIRLLVDTYVEEVAIEAEGTTEEQTSGGDTSERKEIDRSNVTDASNKETLKDLERIHRIRNIIRHNHIGSVVILIS
jgi:hypothetical protein